MRAVMAAMSALRRPAFLVTLAFVLFAAACSASSPEPQALTGGTDDATDSEETVAEEADSGETVAEEADSEETDSEEADGQPEPEPAPQPVEEIEPIVFDDNFGETILPIVTEHCASCHNAGGPGSPHWKLETVADVANGAPFLAAAVGEGYMPPWPAGPMSVSFTNDISLRTDEIDAIVAWAQAGGEIDVDAALPVTAPTGVVGLSNADDVITPHETYDGNTSIVDDYRCLIYDPGLTEATWLTGYEFVPDQAEIVHHAIGYLLPEEAMASALERSAEDPAGGWQCYGSSGLDFDDPLFIGWAPGQGPTVYPEGSGLWLEPGDFVVVQIHYHNEVDTDPDESTLRVDFTDGSTELDEIGVAEYLAPAEIPCSSDETGPLCDRDAAYALAVERFGQRGVQADFVNAICGVTPDDFAGMTDGVASSSCVLPIYEFGEVVSVLAHEHEIGTTFRMTLNPGGPDEQVILDIPTWSFDWQYNYEPVETIVVKPGDSVMLECAWDRALRDPSLEPSYILWADGTNDEMCFATITVR